MIVQRRCLRAVYSELCEDWYMLKRVPANSIRHFIDIGASYGIISMAFKLMNPKSKVYSIEPDPEVYLSLLENTKGMYINTFNVALGNGEPFYLWAERKTPTNNEYRQIKGKSEKIAKSERLETIVNLCGADPDNLMIKCDCEGAESYLMQNEDSRNILGRLKVLVMELHSALGKTEKAFSPSPQELEKFYKGKPYTVTFHKRSDETYMVQIVRNGVL